MPKPIALQLYTVRDLCAENLTNTLATIASIGFKGVELAGLHGRTPSEFARLLSDHGLQAVGAHVPLPAAGSIQQLVDEQAALGVTRVVSGVGSHELSSADDCKRVAERCELAAQELSRHGLELCYHNHWWEFDLVDGQTAYERLFSLSSALRAELDVYWAAYAGKNPLDVLSALKHRVPLLHIKDGTLEQDAPHTAVGKGKLEIAAILHAAETETVAEWFIVELDHCASDMMQAVRDSYAYMTATEYAAGNV